MILISIGVAVSCASGDMALAGAATISRPFMEIVNSARLPGVDPAPKMLSALSHGQIGAATLKCCTRAGSTLILCLKYGLQTFGRIAECRSEA